MSAKYETTNGGVAFPENFDDIEQALVKKLFEATSAGMTDDKYEYILSGTRLSAEHNLAIFCVANSVEPLRARGIEKLRLALPVNNADTAMPVALLGETDDAHYFYLSYAARRGGIKELKVTPETYTRRFTGRHKPPVRDLAQKLERYHPIPMRERISDEYLTD